MSAVPDSQWAKHSDTTTADMHSDKVLGGTNDGPNAMQSKQDASPRKSSISAAADAAAAAASVTAGAMLGSKTPSASNQTPATTTQPRKASFSRPMTLSYAKVASMPVTPPAVTPAAIPTTTPSATSATTSSGFDASWAKQGDPSNLHDNAAFSKPRGVVSSNDMAGAVMAAAASAGAKDSSKAKPGSRRSSAPSGAHDTWRDKHSGVAPPEMYMGNVQSNAQDESDSSQTGWKVYRGKRHYTTAATAGASVPQALRHRGTESDMNLGDDLPASQSRQGASADEGKSRAKTASTAAAATAAAATGILLGAKVGSNAHEAKHGDVVTPEMQLDGVSGNTDVGRVPMQPGDGSSLGETLSRGRQAVSAATQPINISSWPTAPTAQQPKRSGMATPEMQLGDVFGNSEDGFMTSPQRQDTSSSTGSSLTWSVPEGVINPTGHRPRTSTPPPVLPGIQRNRKDGTITPEMHLDDVFGNPEEGFASSQPSAHVSSGSQPNKPEDASSATAPTFAGGASVPLVAPTDVPVGFSALSGTDRPLNAPTPPTSVLTTNPTTGYVQEVKKGETPSSSSSKAPPMAGAAAAAGLTAGALLAAKAASGSEQPSSTSFQKSNDISSTPTVPGVQGARQDGAATPEMQLGDIFGDRDEGLADSANTLYADRSGPTPVVIPLSGFHLPQTVSRQPIAALSLPSDPPITADVGRDNSSDSHQHPYARDEADNVPVGVSGLTDGGRVGGAGEGSPGMVSGASFGSTWPSAGIPQAAGLREGSGGIGAASSKVPDVEQGQIKMNGPNGQAKPTQVKTRIFPDGHDDDHIPIDEDKLELDLSLVPEEEEESRHGTPLDATSSASAHPNGPAGDLDTPSAAKMGAGIAALSVPVGIAAAKHAFDSSSPIGKSEVTDPSDMTTANQAQYPDTGVTASTVSPFGVSAALGSTETDIKHPTTGAAEGSTDASALSHPSATILAPNLGAPVTASPTIENLNDVLSKRAVNPLPNRMEELAPAQHTAVMLHPSSKDEMALEGEEMGDVHAGLDAGLDADVNVDANADADAIADINADADIDAGVDANAVAAEGATEGAADTTASGVKVRRSATAKIAAGAAAGAVAAAAAAKKMSEPIAHAAKKVTEPIANAAKKVPPLPDSIAKGPSAEAVALARHPSLSAEARKGLEPPTVDLSKAEFPTLVIKSPHKDVDYANAPRPLLQQDLKAELDNETVDYTNVARPQLQQDQKEFLNNEQVNFASMPRPQLQQLPKDAIKDDRVDFSKYPHPVLMSTESPHKPVDYNRLPPPVMPEHQKIAQQSDQDLHVKVANAPRPVIDYETVKAQKEELRRNKSVKKENERYAKELAAATALVHKHSRTTAVPAPPTATTIKGEPIEPRNEQDREVFAAAAAITAEQNALKAQKKAEKRERRKDIGKGFFGSLAIFGIGKKLRNRRQADQTPGVVATTVASTAATTAAMISAKSVGKQLASEQAQATTIPSSATDEHAPPATTTASKEEVAKPTVDSAALAPVVASTALVPAVASVGLAQADFNDQEEEGSSSGQAQREAEEQAQREAEEQAAQIAAEKAKRAAEGKALEEAAEMALKEADDKHRREEEEALQAKAREDMLLKARLEREAMERGIRLRMEQEAREAEERLRKEREQQAAAQQVQAMALQRAQFQTPPGYHGPIPNIAAGERLMWIRKVVTTQYFDTDEDYRYYLSSAGGRVDNKIENRTTPNTAVNRGSGFGH
ncbi:hypothetical protein BGZ73_007176 [Actinomortierella ambigua]|nr:hypothetical protein BGZ73_007176 [Actinomortierella ambigua]